MRVNVSFELRRPTRRSVALVLAGLLLLTPAAVLASHQFSDVLTSHTFHGQISAIAKAGVTGGFSDGTYRPSDPVTRQAMAAFMERGFGRVGIVSMTDPVESVIQPVGPQSNFVSVRQVGVTVPGADNEFAPTQFVHIQGHVTFVTPMGDAEGCPCTFEARLREGTDLNPENPETNPAALGVTQRQTFYSPYSGWFAYSFTVEAVFAASPGRHLYELGVRLAERWTSPVGTLFNLSRQSSMSTMTFPFSTHTGGTP